MNQKLPFERMGPYRIERLLGQGGMGMVFAAQHEQTGERAAVKVLSPSLALSGSYRERFDAEVESLRQLRHPHIVRLYGFGEEQGHLFYAMELVEGRNLQEELSAGRRFHWREVADIGVQICSALKHAHDHGVVHRDLKPANLLCSSDDQIKLSDFGIAKLFGSTTVTLGGVLGTADYMAPEQARGENSGYRCDLYSLGAVMYALLTGRPPHVGKSIPEVLHRLRFEQPVPVGRLVDDLPAEMNDIVMQLLQKDPRQRIPTALAVSNRLQAMQHALSVVPRTGDFPAESPTDRAVRSSVDQLAQQPTVAVDLDAQGRPLDPHLDASIISAPFPRDEQREAEVAKSRFTKVGPERPVQQEEFEPTWIRWGAIAALGLLLVTLTAFIWRSLAPATADELYAEIERSQQADNAVHLQQAEEQIGEFLRRFPDDPRRAKVAERQEEIELARLERRLEASVRRAAQGGSLTAAEQLYVQALQTASADPQRAIAMLEVLAALAPSAADEGEKDKPLQRTAQLAARRIPLLRKQLAEKLAQHQEFISATLTRADQLANDQPHAAKQLVRDLLHVYTDQPWASPLLPPIKKKLEEYER